MLILVVEDDQDTREAYQMFLGMKGFEVTCAASGADALTVMRATPADVVLLDLTLPDMDGRDLARELRALARPGVSMLAITGHRPEPSWSSEFCRVMQKPIRLEDVATWLSGLAPEPAGGA